MKNIIISVIRIWLWATSKEKLSKLSPTGTVSKLDDECKWLVRASVEVAVRDLNEKKLKLSKFQESSNDSAPDVKFNIAIATLASQSLAQGFRHNEDMVSTK